MFALFPVKSLPCKVDGHPKGRVFNTNLTSENRTYDLHQSICEAWNTRFWLVLIWCVLISFYDAILDYEIRLSSSKYFSFIKLKANAPAEALKTEKSNAPLIPVEKVIAKANVNNKTPLNFANSSVLNPIRRKNAKTISAPVAKMPINGINESGNQGFINLVYSKKLFQLPHTETFLLQIPNLSATADKKPIEIASRKYSLINLFHISICFSLMNLCFISVESFLLVTVFLKKQSYDFGFVASGDLEVTLFNLPQM